MRIEDRFTELRKAGKTGLVTYVTAGDPDLTRSAEIISSRPACSEVILFGFCASSAMGTVLLADDQRGGRAA